METRWWEENTSWNNGQIYSNAHSKKVTTLWLMLLLISVGCGYVIYGELSNLIQFYESRQYQEMTILLILFIPFLLLIQCIKRIRDNARFGNTPLSIDPFPCHIGGNFIANITIEKGANDKTFKAQLLLNRHTQNQRIAQDDNHKPDISSQLVWRMPVTVRTERIATGVRLSLEARLPDDTPPSEPSYQDQFHSWHLSVSSTDNKFDRTWDVLILPLEDI